MVPRKQRFFITLLALMLCAGTPWASVSASCTGSHESSEHAMHRSASATPHAMHAPVEHNAQAIGHVVSDHSLSSPSVAGPAVSGPSVNGDASSDVSSDENHAVDDGSCSCCEQASCALTHCGSSPAAALQFLSTSPLFVMGTLNREHFSFYEPVKPHALYRPPIFR